MDTSLALTNALAPSSYSRAVKAEDAAGDIPSVRCDAVEISSPSSRNGGAQDISAPAQDSGSDEPVDGKSKLKEKIGNALKFSAAVLGGAVGLALAPIGGTALGAYAGITGRQFINIDAFGDPGYIGAEVHQKILEKTGSKALAIAGGTAAGIPTAIVISAFLFPFLGFGMTYGHAAKIVDKFLK